MADYPLLAPTLNALQAVKDLPTGSEVLSKLDDVDRQTRNWIYDFLSLYIDSATGKIKPTAFAVGGSLPPGMIRGSNSVSNVQQEIAQGSIRTLDLADSAVTAAKIALGTITGNKLVPGTITGDKVAAGTLTGDHIAPGILNTAAIADLAITDGKIGVGEITGQRLAGSTIQNSKMGLRSVLGPQLPIATAGQILVGGNGTNQDELAVKKVTGSFVVDKDGKFSYAGLTGSIVSFARVVEVAAFGVGGGTSVTNVWTARGANTSQPWNIIQTTRNFLQVIPGSSVIRFNEGGTYLVTARAPAQGVGAAMRHRIMLIYAPYGPDGREYHFGSSVDAANAIISHSTLSAIVTVDPSLFPVTTPYIPFIALYHWVSGAAGANGFGQASSAPKPTGVTEDVPEFYSEVTVLRLVEPDATE